jgi:serine/threonine protein kinase
VREEAAGWIGRRYQILNELGQGAMGAVYRALDRLTGHVVTVKLMHRSEAESALASGGTEGILSREFRLLTSLRHPNVVGVLDYGLHDDEEAFLVMDLEENARSIVEAGSEAPAALQIDLLVQLLRALAYLHRLGICHRDVKPANVVVVRGQVKLLDFGLAVARHELELDSARWVGSLAYMAPELIRGEAASEASDLYAAGMVAYELLTGGYPFALNSSMELQRAIETVSLPRASDALDPRLRPVLTRWLAKDRATRCADAGEVIADLGAALGTAFDAETLATRESVLHTAPLIGRDDELAALEGALRAAAQGRGGTWLVSGESGVGKSRLLDEFRTRALVEGAVVVRGQTVNLGGAPYHAWRDVIGALALRVDLDDREAEVLGTVVPTIDDLLDRPVAPAPEIDAEAAQTRLLLTVEDLLRRQPRCVVIILEDLHWAGSESLRLLVWLLQTTERSPVLVVGSFREDEAPDLPARVLGSKLLPLRRLRRDEVAALGESLIGGAARQPELLDLLERETEGNPLFIVEVVRALAESSGALDRVGSQRLPMRVASGGIHRVIRRRLGGLPPEALPALRTAAVVGRRIEPTLLRTLHPELDVDRWLTTCSRTAVLGLRDQQWVFAHDKLREQILEDLSEADRRDRHLLVARALERLYAERPDGAAALAHHWREAGDAAKEALYARHAGMRSLQNGACREAVDYLQRALDLLLLETASTAPRSRRRGRLDPNALVRSSDREFLLGSVEGALSEAFYRMGDLESCRVHSERALRHFGQKVPSTTAGWATGTLGQIALRLTQGTLRVKSADPVEARTIAGEVSRVQLRLAETCFYSLRLGGILWSTFRVVNQCEPAGPSPELAQGYVTLVLLAGLSRAVRLADHWSRRALSISEGTGNDRNVAYVRSRLAVYQLSECRFPDAAASIDRATTLAERVGDLRLREEARVQRAMVALYTARFEESMADFREGQTLSRRSGNRQVECWAIMGQGTVACRLGDDRDAIRFEEEALTMIDESVLKTEAVCAYGVLALARLREQDPAGAYEAAGRSVDHIRSMAPVAYWTQQSIAATAEVLLSLRENGWTPNGAVASHLRTQGIQAVQAMQRFARHIVLGRPQALIWKGLLASLEGKESSARKLWSGAVLLAERLGMPYECGRAHLEIARHLPVGHVDRRRHLERARDVFEGARCRWELARTHEQIGRD